jgi:DNA-binding MarR family transcriptional regulator
MDNSIGYSIKKLHLATRQLLDQALATYGLSQAQSEIIYYLLQQDNQTQAELSRKLKVSAPTITRMVDVLIDKGLVRRVDDTRDARQKQVQLTPKGTQFKNEIAAAQQRVELTLRKGFSAAEITTFQKYIARMADNIIQAKAQ